MPSFKSTSMEIHSSVDHESILVEATETIFRVPLTVSESFPSFSLIVRTSSW